MHEYRLYTTIPTLRKPQVLNIFAGITASQPVAITQQVLVYQQLKAENNAPAAKKGQAKPATAVGQQQQRLHYVKLVRDVVDGTAGGWRLRVEGLPDPAAKTVISQSVMEREVTDDAELAKFRPGSEAYKFVSQYVSSGTRFVHNNIVIYMTRLYGSTTPSDTDPLDAPPPTTPDNGALLDRSGAWLVEVCVRVDDGGNSTLRDKATKELEGFKRELDRAVDLRVPDRLALDPRVR